MTKSKSEGQQQLQESAAPQTSALVKAQQFQKFLQDRHQQFESMMPRPERTRAFLEAWRQYALAHPDVMDCTVQSLRDVFVACAMSGIMPHGPVPGGYILAFYNSRKRQREAVLVVDYRCLIDLAVRGGGCRGADAHLIRENDSFDYRVVDGRERVDHSWPLDGERGEIVGAWAWAELPNGLRQYAHLTRKEIDAIMKRAPSGSRGDSPWKTDYPMMALKSALRRVLNLIPKSAEKLMGFATALQADARSDLSIPANGLHEPTGEEKRLASVSRTEELAAAIESSVPQEGAASVEEEPRED
jgi:recombination protein RecT